MDVGSTELFTTILVVEDEKEILALLKLALPRYGFDPILVGSGDEAVEVFRRRWQQIAAVLMDVQMPGLDGLETLAILQEVDPSVRCCFISGDPGKFSEKRLSEFGEWLRSPKNRGW